jgi:DNA invertase Pin-like site-specific DNA recombinase
MVYGGLKPQTLRILRRIVAEYRTRCGTAAGTNTGDGALGRAPSRMQTLSPGTRLLREWNGSMEAVEVVDDGFIWRDSSYRTLSAVAVAITGTKWSGPKFFGLLGAPSVKGAPQCRFDTCINTLSIGGALMAEQKQFRCAVYTRKSSEEGLEQDFNSLEAQREACEAYVRSQSHEGWKLLPDRFDDGGFSGGNMQRPGLDQLMAEVRAGKVDVIVIYKIDRLTRSLTDFARLAEVLDKHGVSFVSVTQQFNTTTSMGRLMLNVLLSFAQFEREITGERIRDKIAASKKKGMWMGGPTPMGYDVSGRTLVINETDATIIRRIFEGYLAAGDVPTLLQQLTAGNVTTSRRTSVKGNHSGGRPFTRGHLYKLLSNPIYIGRIPHKATSHPGQHPAIIERSLWDRVQAQLAANTQGTRKRRRRAGRTARAEAVGAVEPKC